MGKIWPVKRSILLALPVVLFGCSSPSSDGPGNGNTEQPAPITNTPGNGSENPTPGTGTETPDDGEGTETPVTPLPPNDEAGVHAFDITEEGRFTNPWSMTFLPDGSLLVTEKSGALRIRQPNGTVGTISGVPAVVEAGQGGFGDVVLHPDFATNNRIYISFAEAGTNNRVGAAVASATLVRSGNGGSLQNVKVIWQQTPKVQGTGHFGHRMAFDADGKLWISSSERQQMTPAQDLNSNLGKILRLNDDGTVPSDNPFADRGGLAAQVWSYGHRNPLGLAFDSTGKLWSHEMGPQGGDELNLIERGGNYGWPVASNGANYGATADDIPDHRPGDGFIAPKISWSPVIAPAGFVIYSGDAFPQWKGNGFIGGLVSRGLVRVSLVGDQLKEIERLPLGDRIREVEQGPDGALWVLEDNGNNKRLLKLTPKQ